MQDPTTTFALLQQLKQPQFPEQEQQQQLRCPRCDSKNTKFCYYNNYNLSQPRHFCKSCRRYWTKGGSLRNIPVGGATRKTSKRPSSSSSTTPAKRPASSPLPPLSAGPNPEPGPGSGGFNSLLASNGQFGNLLQGIRSDSDRVLHLPSSCGVGESSQIVGESVRCWANDGDQNSNDGWPDLAIFTPASGFH